MLLRQRRYCHRVVLDRANQSGYWLRNRAQSVIHHQKLGISPGAVTLLMCPTERGKNQLRPTRTEAERVGPCFKSGT